MKCRLFQYQMIEVENPLTEANVLDAIMSYAKRMRKRSFLWLILSGHGDLRGNINLSTDGESLSVEKLLTAVHQPNPGQPKVWNELYG